MTLKELKPGESARIEKVGGKGALRQHFLDMGLIPGCDVTVVKLAPMGDPMELMIRGYELTLRLDDAERIKVTPIQKNDETKKTTLKQSKTLLPSPGEAFCSASPGLG